MGTIAALSLAGSLLCALFLLALIHAHAPMTDASASEPYFALLFDPLVLPVVIAWTLFSAVIVFPFGVWLLRGRKIVPTFLVVLAATLLAVVTVIPVAKAIGLKRGWWASGYLAVVAALIACRWMPALKLPSREGRA
jgi:hypothetical protein